jgi:hypothetical protein
MNLSHRLASRSVAIGMILMITAGFRLIEKQHGWDISRTDRTLWVKYCDGLTSDFDSHDYPAGDDLAGTTPTLDQIRASILSDFNSVAGSYLRLAAYPADPLNPPAPQTGDTAFTEALASTRTIEICTGNPAGSSGGQATPTIENGQWTGCLIELPESLLTGEASDFVETLTHEMGHCVGLAHPQDTTHAIMSYFKPAEEIRLMIDDRMGIIHLYPTDSASGDEQNTFGVMGCGPS